MPTWPQHGSIFEVPGGLGRLLGALGRLLGRLGGVLEGSGGILRRHEKTDGKKKAGEVGKSGQEVGSGAVLEASWADLSKKYSRSGSVRRWRVGV